MICPLCGVKQFKTAYQLSDSTVYWCVRCRLYVKEGKIKNTQDYYDKNYYSSYPYSTWRNLNQRYFINKIKSIKKLVRKKSPTVLDVGCGWGDFLAVLQEKEVPYLGIDVSDEAVRQCQQKGLHCKKISLEALGKSGKKYDAITSFQTIEHLENPLPFLQSARRLLAKNGIMILTTPNNDSPLRKLLGRRWMVYNTDSHFVFYNKKTLKKMLDKAGFKQITVQIDSPRFMSLGYILSRLNKAIDGTLFKPASSIPIITDPTGDLEAVACL